MCAYNEAEHIEEKLYNLSSLLYPNELYDIHIYFDGCTDQTYKTAKKVSKKLFKHKVRCNLHLQNENKGKVSGLNYLISETRGKYDVLVFTDVSALLSIDALNKIEEDFTNPNTIITTGQYTLDDSAPRSQQSYWQYQNTLKGLESNVGSVIGVPGAMFAVRPERVSLLEKNTINDDFILSMRALALGGDAIINNDIVMYERECDTQSADYMRRERLGAGNWQQIKILFALMNPKLGWTSINFLSHKVLRGVMPILLLFVYATVVADLLIYQSLWSVVVGAGLTIIHLISAMKSIFRSKRQIY